jgi:hypothetical protein
MNFRRALLVAVAMLAVSSAAMAADPGYFIVNSLPITSPGYLDMQWKTWGVVKTSPNWAGVDNYVTTSAIRSTDAVNEPNGIGTIASVDGTVYAAYLGSTFHLYNPVAAGNSLLQVTYYGDSNLDGLVNGDDYGFIDYAYQGGDPGVLTGWIGGDYNHDGLINSDDYGYIDFAYQVLNAGGAGSNAAVSAVPEPSLILLLITGVLGLVAYWRKNVKFFS